MGRARKTDKRCDCIKCKREVQARIYEEIRGLSHAEEIAHFSRTAEEGPLGARWKKIKARQGQ